MHQTSLLPDPVDRARLIRQARVYIEQARATNHRGWAFTLREWAAKCRLNASAGMTPRCGSFELSGPRIPHNASAALLAATGIAQSEQQG